MASGSTKFVRWPWLILAGLGFIGCVAFLLLSLTGRKSSRSAPARQGAGYLSKQAATAPASDAAPASGPMTGGVPAERAPTAMAPPMPAPTPPPAPTTPTLTDTKKSDEPAMAPPPSKAAKKVGKPEAPKPAAPSKPMPRATAGLDDDAASPPPQPAAEGFAGRIGKLGTKADKPHPAKKHKRAHKDVNDPSPAGRGRALGPKGPPGEEDGDAHGKAESRAHADLLPGSFSAKVPQRMLINESVRVRVTVVEKKDERKAAAVLEAAPVGPGPAKIVTEEVLVGKLLRVELRGLSREFEILPITPPEQRLYPGRVAQWEWAVVPHEEGQHELSIVVTNLFDWSGRPLDLTVHSSIVSVDVTTMQRLRGYASIVSSIFSGITGLIGAWMALLRPFLKRRAEKEDEEKEKKKDRDAKDGGDGKPPEKAPEKLDEKPPEKPADPVAIPPPAVAQPADASQKPAQ